MGVNLTKGGNVSLTKQAPGLSAVVGGVWGGARPPHRNVRNAFIRVVNQTDQSELARYDLSEDASTETAMFFGEIYRNGAEWKFRAVGQGYSAGLSGIARDFGVNV